MGMGTRKIAQAEVAAIGQPQRAVWDSAKALSSIKADLDKRMKEFAKHGVNNINGYMKLYKQKLNPKPDVKYPEQPIPHLILVSNEFAELKSNVQSFWTNSLLWHVSAIRSVSI